MITTTFGRTTINKSSKEITLEDVRQECEKQDKRASQEWAEWNATSRKVPFTGFAIDYSGIRVFIDIAAINDFSTLPAEIIGICSFRNYEDNHSSFFDMVDGMRKECEYAMTIINATMKELTSALFQ